MASVKAARLIVAASESNADMLYATRFFVPDPFAFLEANGRTAILLSDLEVDRGRKQARVDVVVSYSEIEAGVKPRAGTTPGFAQVIAAFVKSRKARKVTVPADFPLALARQIEAEGVRLEPVAGHFWPAREFKDAADLRALSAALRMTEAAMGRALEILKAAAIRKKDRVLIWAGSPLTAGRLRAEVESAIVFAGGIAMNNSIVACGAQACDPHERGHGPLKGHELIILDIFPRSAKTGFFGDMTRTVVRGRASDAQRRLWETCLAGQKMALRALAPGGDGKALQDSVRDFFTAEGYPTERRDGRWQGFFHGLGHGLGLEIHEEPRLGRTTFRAGQVFTIEPGIYLPGLGGVRHEDVAVITASGHRLLSRFPKPLEI